jgi:hypothetical protein
MLSDVHPKFYSASGYLTVGKVTVLYVERVIFKRCVPKKHKVKKKKNYAFFDMSGYVHKWMCTYGSAGHLQVHK